MSLRSSLARACCGVVGTALGVRTPGQAFALQWAIGKAWFHHETPVSDPKDPFCEGGVGYGGGGLIQSRVSSQKQGKALRAGTAWPEGKGEEAICPIFC